MNKHILIYLLIISSLQHSIGWCRSSRSSIEARLDSLENKLESNLSLELVNKIEDLQRELQELRGMLEDKRHHVTVANVNDSVNNVPEKIAVMEKHRSSDQIAYDAAHKLVEEKNFTEAIVAFKEFLVNHNDSVQVPNATYWLGELYLTEHNFEVAADYFLEVVSKHHDHIKAPDALLKLGLLELERENWQGAKDYFNKIKTNYSHSSRVHMAEAKLQGIEREGH